jgi:pimeloyl-ACP methyl ester carboxylesterase
MRETFIFNAPTWVDEMKEPAAFSLDLAKLSLYGGPLLISHGDQSPPFFPAIVEQIADAVPRAQRHVFRGAGHVPHLSHPDDYALVIGSFISGVAGAA